MVLGLLDEDLQQLAVHRVEIGRAEIGLVLRRDQAILAQVPAGRANCPARAAATRRVGLVQRRGLAREGARLGGGVGAQALRQRVAAVDEVEDGRGCGQALLVQQVEQVLHAPAHRAERGEADHVGRPLEGVRDPPQVAHRHAIGRRAAQARGRCHPLAQQLLDLLQEDLEDLRVEIERGIRRQRRHRCQFLDQRRRSLGGRLRQRPGRHRRVARTALQEGHRGIAVERQEGHHVGLAQPGERRLQFRRNIR